MKITTRTINNITGHTGCKLLKDQDEEPYEYCLCDFNQCNDMYPVYNSSTTITTGTTTTASSNSAISSVSIPLLIFTIVILIV